jgi:hypothetical protein
MKQTKEEPIIYKVQLLEGLIEKQQGLLETANRIIDMKTRLVELCEEETAIYRRENQRLKIMFIASLITIITVSSVLVLSLLL